MFTLLFLALAAAGVLITVVGLANPDMTGMLGIHGWLAREIGGEKAERMYSEYIRWSWIGVGVLMAVGGVVGAGVNAIGKR